MTWEEKNQRRKAKKEDLEKVRTIENGNKKKVNFLSLIIIGILYIFKLFPNSLKKKLKKEEQEKNKKNIMLLKHLHIKSLINFFFLIKKLYEIFNIYWLFFANRLLIQIKFENGIKKLEAV